MKKIALLIVPAVFMIAPRAEGGEFSVSGYIQSQAGYFFSDEEYAFHQYERNIDLNGDGIVGNDFPVEVDDILNPGQNVFPVDHGGYGGQLSMFRNTLQLEAEWRPSEKVTVFGIVRGVRSSILDADRYAQPPEPDIVDDRKKWVWENFYNELEIRELYVDAEAGSRLSFRVGRQQVAWGETGQYRLLDVINPIDGTWHLSAFEGFEDVRIPLWMLKGLVDVPELDGSLEFVWMPALDRPEDMVTPPVTQIGAWGLPLQPKQTYQSPLEIKRKLFIYPENKLENSRAGANWKGTLGNLTYTLMYFYTHVLSPPILKYAFFEYQPDGILKNEVAELGLHFPRQHITGFSLEYTFAYPVGTVARLEASFEPDRSYPIKSQRAFGYEAEITNVPGEYQKYDFVQVKKPTFSYALVLMTSKFIRFLNPQQSFLFNVQVFQTVIPTLEEADAIIDVPGYDTTEASVTSTKFIVAVLTSYFHGLLSPVFIGIIDPTSPDTGAVRALTKITLGNHWRFETGVNIIWAPDPYQGLGLYRDRDEVYTKIQYQF